MKRGIKLDFKRLWSCYFYLFIFYVQIKAHTLHPLARLKRIGVYVNLYTHFLYSFFVTREEAGYSFFLYICIFWLTIIKSRLETSTLLTKGENNKKQNLLHPRQKLNRWLTIRQLRKQPKETWLVYFNDRLIHYQL